MMHSMAGPCGTVAGVVIPPAATRTAVWLVSLTLHAAALVAAGHGAAPSSGVERVSLDDLSIDIAPDLGPERDAPRPVTDVAASVPFVSPGQAHTEPMPQDPGARTRDRSAPRVPGAATSAPAPEDTAMARDVAPLPLAPARFAMTVASDPPVAASRSVRDEHAGQIPAGEPGSDLAPWPEDRVSSAARLATAMAPEYPARASAQEIEADVVLAIVVTSSGAVADAHVIQSAGFGLDESALHAMRAARFAPAQHDGRRVAVRMHWTVSFRLH
jgi:TonB family protein